MVEVWEIVGELLTGGVWNEDRGGRKTLIFSTVLTGIVLALGAWLVWQGSYWGYFLIAVSVARMGVSIWSYLRSRGTASAIEASRSRRKSRGP